MLRPAPAHGNDPFADLHALGEGLGRRSHGTVASEVRVIFGAEALDVDAERIARCSFCRKHDWEVGRLVAGGDGRTFLCDEREAMVHVVMTATPVPAPLGRPPVVPESIRIDWQKLAHHQTRGPR